MKGPFLIASLVFLVCGVASGQKFNFKPHTLIPGVGIQAADPMVEPNKLDQAATLSFFANTIVGIPGPIGGKLEFVDVDADHDLDILQVDGTIKLYEFDLQNQVYQEVTTAGLGMSVTAHYVADINRDNLVDIMFVENRAIKIAFNDGDKSFTVIETGVVIDWDGAPPLYCIDVDGDTDLDIVTRPTPTFYAFIPSQRFGTTQTVTYPPEFSFMSFANLDNWGVLDFFLVYADYAGYAVKSNTLTNGELYNLASAPAFNVPSHEVRWVDVDLDGLLDLFTLTTTGWKLFRNSGAAQFAYVSTLSSSLSSASAVGDLNSDGRPDFVVNNESTTSIDIYLNQSASGTISFVLDQSIPAGVLSPNLYIIDWDGYQGLDIVTHYYVLRNTLTTLSAPPLPPTNPVCRYNNGSLMLSWQKPGNGLQYRYEVFLDGEMIVSSESDDAGIPLRPQKAPGVQETTVVLTSLPEGQYAFRVQAVDASFRGSAFSPLKEMDVPVSIEEESVDAFDVFPNPATERFQVSVPNAGTITVFDPVSRIVLHQVCDPDAKQSLEVVTREWPTGVYVVQFEGGGKRHLRKLIVSR